jgi:hypothetical protein
LYFSPEPQGHEALRGMGAEALQFEANSEVSGWKDRSLARLAWLSEETSWLVLAKS